MPTIYAAMVELDNRNEFQGLNSAGFGGFDTALAQAKALFDTHATGEGDIRLFLAPEYSFSGHAVTEAGGININSLSRDDKHRIYRLIEAASAQYNDIVIVAGTIAYSKKSFFSARKYLSVCPVALNGQIILKCYKQSFDGFQAGAAAASFHTKYKGNTFIHRGVSFGVEICSDHRPDHKVLKQSLAGGTVQVHLLISEGMSPSPGSIAAGEGGLVINCDMSGHGGGNGIRTVTRNRFGNPALDAAATGPIAEAEAHQAFANGTHIVLYRGAV